MSRGQLRLALDKMGQDTEGTRSVLVERLEACLMEESPPVGASPDCHSVPPNVSQGPRNLRGNLYPIRNQYQEYLDNAHITEAPHADYDNRSCMSAASTVSDKVRLAGLQARAACLKQKHELDRRAQDIQAMQESLELDMQIREVKLLEKRCYNLKDSEIMSS